jgi:glycosyltransferase involved in cell wall biosynthesis
MRELTIRDRGKEIIRIVSQEFWRRDYFRQRCVRKAKAILVCNEQTRQKFCRSQKKLFFFPVNGISSEDFCLPNIRTSAQKKFTVIYAGRLDPIKGLALGLKSFKVFVEKYPDSKFEIIGKGPEEFRLKNLVHELGIYSHISFIPWLSREDLLKKLVESDVFLFPSFRDGGGAVIIEAMASGLPVICLDNGGPGFHIKEEWGIKIFPGNSDYVIQQIAESLEKLYLRKDLRIKMGISAQQRARDFYLWDRLGEKMQQIYHAVLDTDKTHNFNEI